jgi:hypothetical protein
MGRAGPLAIDNLMEIIRVADIGRMQRVSSSNTPADLFVVEPV